ncbi:hypothetical protein Ade02nite_95320 [Paractinoplanes deccanensis]|uniref:Uncharacterized protein n=1 Tax=Paractinoplanes deccanensis TaxID=113561 RepID=A0ABQ3YLM4_9ACTN|nr:hypothetical protein Ade02nite_95320 [Actinoplanes deccanensis]
MPDRGYHPCSRELVGGFHPAIATATMARIVAIDMVLAFTAGRRTDVRARRLPPSAAEGTVRHLWE